MSKYTGHVQTWQLSDVADSLVTKASHDLLLYLTSPTGATNIPHGLAPFISSCRGAILQLGTIDWEDCPDDHFKLIWMRKQQGLVELYTLLTRMHAMYVPNGMFASIYQEKYEDAIGVLSGQIQQGPLLRKSTDAHTVAAARVEWMSILSILDQHRIDGKRAILSADTVTSIDGIIDNIRSELIAQEVK